MVVLFIGMEKRMIYEFHHAMGGELERDADNIANIAISIIKQCFDNGFSVQDIEDYLDENPISFNFSGSLNQAHSLRKRYHIKALDLDTTVYIAKGDTLLTNSRCNVILVSFNRVLETIETGDYQALSSLIYHELGHATNIVKSDFSDSEIVADFKKPMFLGLDDDEYKTLHKMLYRFHMREMKARCFETKMFLNKNRNQYIPIKDVYGSRCSDITLMREFVNLLKRGAEMGPNSKEGKILNDVSRNTWEAQNERHIWTGKGFGTQRIRWKKKCENTLRFFQKRLDWFKKRIDKIYYDYINGE